jgi:hypothetical protein
MKTLKILVVVILISLGGSLTSCKKELSAVERIKYPLGTANPQPKPKQSSKEVVATIEEEKDLELETLKVYEAYEIMLERYQDTLIHYQKSFKVMGWNPDSMRPGWRKEFFQEALEHHNIKNLENRFKENFGSKEYFLLKGNLKTLRRDKLLEISMLN